MTDTTTSEWLQIQGVGHHATVTRRELPDDTVASVVVLNFNGGELVLECVRSVRRQTVAAELIVVDNDSTDGSLERVEELARPEVVIRCDRNLGFARGMNLGFVAARHDLIVLLNDDASLHPGFLAAALDVTVDPSVGLLGGPSWRPTADDGTPPLLDAGPIALTRTMRVSDLPDPRRSRPVMKTTGSALGLVRSRLEAAGLLLDGAPFDESFWTYGEDNDLSLRAARRDVVTYYDARLESKHARSASSAERIWDKRGRLRRNLIASRHRNITRHLGGPQRLTARALALGEDAALVARQLRHGDGRVLGDLASAYLQVQRSRGEDRLQYRQARALGSLDDLPMVPTRRRYGP